MSIPLAGAFIEGLGRAPKNHESSYQYLLIRLLLGTANLRRGSFTVKQHIDYSTLPFTAQTKAASLAVRDFLASYSIGGSVPRFIKLTRADNREFYREILAEFLNFHIHSAQGKHTSGFVFLYRVFERICYTVPLLYAATQSDYMGTFKDLKAILHADAEGELGLFKKFLMQGKFIDKIKLQILLKLSFTSSHGHAADYYDLSIKKFTNFASADQTTHQVEIKFSDVPEFLKVIRNRFFHSRTGDGRDNITSTSLPDSDEYFSAINPTIASFLSIVVLHTLQAKYQK